MSDEPEKEARTDAAERPAELRHLDSSRLRFHRCGATLRLTLEGECSYPKVTAVRAFPISQPARHVSIRDGKGHEVGLITDLQSLEPTGRALVEEELARRYVIPVILRVKSSKERFGTVEWTVDTDRGERRLTTRHLREESANPSPGRYLLTDVDGNRYDVPNLNALDPASRMMLLQHL